MKPKILITARSCMNGNNPAYQVNKAYVDAIVKCGGNPVIMTPRERQDIEDMAEIFDGLLVTGGDDLEPTLYNQIPHPLTKSDDYGLDLMDLQLIRHFFRFSKPILGICRGIQAINVALGGTLYQDIPSEYPSVREEGHSGDETNPNYHLVYFEKNTYGEQVFGRVTRVNSYHHQNIKVLGKELMVSGVSEDGLIEAVQANQLFAVQWHPEKMQDIEEQMQLFKDFVEMCK